LLQNDQQVLSHLRQRFSFIMVDETQDTNFAQFKIVELLGAHNNIFIVGDPDQSVYSWRGARYQNIEDFIKKRKLRLFLLQKIIDLHRK
jgi:DNA helicase-2/ATP-dependent DNA helicase PcrA